MDIDDMTPEEAEMVTLQGDAEDINWSLKRTQHQHNGYCTQQVSAGFGGEEFAVPESYLCDALGMWWVLEAPIDPFADPEWSLYCDSHAVEHGGTRAAAQQVAPRPATMLIKEIAELLNPIEPLAHNTARSGDGTVPVVLTQPEEFPFEPGEREQKWHVATPAELDAYESHWDAQHGEG